MSKWITPGFGMDMLFVALAAVWVTWMYIFVIEPEKEKADEPCLATQSTEERGI